MAFARLFTSHCRHSVLVVLTNQDDHIPGHSAGNWWCQPKIEMSPFELADRSSDIAV